MKLDLSEYFVDPEDDPITYTAVNQEGDHYEVGIVTFSLSAGILTVNAVRVGTANLFVTAENEAGSSGHALFVRVVE